MSRTDSHHSQASAQPAEDRANGMIAELEQALQALHMHAERQARWLRRGLLVGLLLATSAGIAGYGFAWQDGNRKLDTAHAEAAAQLQAMRAQSQDTTVATRTGGITLPPSTNPSVTKLQKVAATGDYKAQTQLAGLYETGTTLGIAQNPQLTQALLQNAAAGGYPGAMYELGRAYATGRLNDSRADRHAAARWLEAAAATGHGPAAFELGALYEAGLDGAPDGALALSWYQRAASYGSDPALAAIARLAPKDAMLDMAGIQELQKALRELGYDIGTADGKLNRRTQDAIRTYQAQLGMTADGRASRSLLERVTTDRVGQGG